MHFYSKEPMTTIRGIPSHEEFGTEGGLIRVIPIWTREPENLSS